MHRATVGTWEEAVSYERGIPVTLEHIEREIDRESVCVRERDRESVCVCERERESHVGIT